MIGKTVLAALLAGLLAGLFASLIHHWRLEPQIVMAESYETGAGQALHTHSHEAEHYHDPPSAHDRSRQDDNAQAHQLEDGDSHDEGWKPRDGLQRFTATSLSWALAGAGFGLLLAAAHLLTGLPLNISNSALWGLCAFLAINLVPAAGLPPGLPGMPEAPLEARQIWWVTTAACTASAICLVACRRQPLAFAAALALLILPFIIGAPHVLDMASPVPASLAASFVANSLTVNAVFWLVLGLLLSLFLPRFSKEPHS